MLAAGVAVTVQVIPASRNEVAPLEATVHADGVLVEKVIGNPEDVVAVAVCPTPTVGGFVENEGPVIVWVAG